MATIQCKGCGKSYSDNPNLYDGEVHCPHCGLSADGTEYIAHYSMPDKPGMVWLAPALVLIVIAIVLFMFDLRILGVALGLLAILLAWAWYFKPFSDYNLANSDYKAYQKLMNERQAKEVKRMEANQKQQEEADSKKYNYYKYRCPMCGSNKIGNLSTLSKAASIELFGAASKKLGKCYYCDDCKYMW